MDNDSDSGPDKKPTPRTNSRPSSTRTPPPVRKPATRKPAASKTGSAPASKRVSAPKVAAEPEVVLGARGPAAAAPRPAEPTVHSEPAASADLAVAPETSADRDSAAVAVVAPAFDVTPGLITGEIEPPQGTVSTATPPGRGGTAAAWARRVAAASGARVAALRDDRAARVSAKAALTAEKPTAVVATAKTPTKPAKVVAKTPKVVTKPLFTDQNLGEATFSPGSTTVLSVRGLTKSFDGTLAVSGVDLEVQVGAFYGIVGPNGAGKTTTLSMITGLMRPDSGTVVVNGSDVWTDTVQAKRMMGVLPDRLRLFDRLTGAQLLYYAGVLRGLDAAVVRERTADLAHAFGLEESLGRLVSDYSAGMTKKIALAAAMIHSPRLLVLDEPFESVDPVSAATVTEILKKYVAAGGTVVLSSHSMDLVQRICDHVAVVVRGEILADGTMAEVRDGQTLEERFVELAGGRTAVEGLEWLHTFSG